MDNAAVLKSGIVKLLISELSVETGLTIATIFTSSQKFPVLTVLFALVMGSVTAAGSVFYMIGLARLRKANLNLALAFWLKLGSLIFSIGAAVLSFFVPDSSKFTSFSLVLQIINVLTVFAIVDGFREILPSASAAARRTLLIYTFCQAGSLIVQFSVDLFPGITNITNVISYILLTFSTVIYVIYLFKAYRYAG